MASQVQQGRPNNPAWGFMFDEGATSHTVTEVVSGADVEIQGRQQWVPGVSETSALRFDGNTHLQPAVPEVAPPWTLAVWVNRAPAAEDSTAKPSTLFGGVGCEIRLEMNGIGDVDAVSAPHVGVAAVVGGRVRKWHLDYSAPLGQWVHLGFVCVDGTLSFYLNGICLQSTEDAYFNGLTMPNSFVGCGVDGDALARHLHGTLDETFGYRRALTSYELGSLASVSGVAQPLSRSRSRLVDIGLQQSAWLDPPLPSVADWERTHRTTPEYPTRAGERRLEFEKDFQDGRSTKQWGTRIIGAFNDGVEAEKIEDHLPRESSGYQADLVWLQIGDEAAYSPSIIENFKDWFEAGREKLGDVLVFQNFNLYNSDPTWTLDAATYGRQGQRLEAYLRYSKPDLFIHTYFYYKPTYIMPTAKPFADMMWARLFALQGTDGLGRSPIGFGAYQQNARTGPKENPEDRYVMSESEINLLTFITWTMGGSWVSLHRWETGAPGAWIIYRPEEPYPFSPQFDQYNRLTARGNALSDYLTRLVSTDVRMIPGKSMYAGEYKIPEDRPKEGGTEDDNPLPKHMARWGEWADPYITDIAVENIGTANWGLPGDVLIGYFKPLPGLPAERRGPIVDPHAKYFMVLNGLTATKTAGNAYDPDDPGGSAAATRQRIALTIDFRGERCDLYRFFPDHRQVGRVALTQQADGTFTTSFELGGGTAALFYWGPAGTP